MDVQKFLKGNGVAFESIEHEQAYTAQEVAAAEHVSGHKFAKTVIVKGGDEVFMLVLPASRHVDFKKAADVVGTKVKMVSEEQMKEIFPDCEIGAEAPFGSQYGVKTFVDESLREADEISFRAGAHDKGIKMSYADYEALEKPATGSFSIQAG
ncbi:MAG: YbaK/EbsC family protein [Candidatus Brocadiae bacterium]|nr:YbaK/EbsC family protein [Candidatus Brocadiia bacterium]